MPGMTGLELVKKLRSEGMTLAVILASGTVPAEELSQNPWLKIDAVLSKPFTIAELVKTMDGFCTRPSPPGRRLGIEFSRNYPPPV